MLKVGIFLPVGNGDWLGGVNYFRNLLTAANRYSEGRYRIILLTDQPERFEGAAGDFSVVEACPELNWRGSPARFMSHMYAKAGGHNLLLKQVAQRHRLDLISHNHIGSQRTLPTLCWIPDFQHRALPHLFSAAEWRGRERNIGTAMRLGEILVSSQSAHDDFRRYYPDSHVRVHVLRFAAMSTGQFAAGTAVAELRERYALPERFVFMPNQFWEHKNHALAIEALAHCGEHVTIVCTGSTADYRNPAHFPTLQSLIRERGIESRFRVLGVIPYADVVSLMRNAVAVLNPSRFEGWSTTVEEAKSLCKQLLLSSIPVHFEQAEDQAQYFDPDDAPRLGKLLSDTLAMPHTQHPSEAQLGDMAMQRQREFVDCYFRIISLVATKLQR